MAEAALPANAAHIDPVWLVSHRSAIQKQMLRLYLTGEQLNARGMDQKYWPVYGVLVGIAFSLWRAVFLVRDARNSEQERQHGQQALKILIEDNAIGYPQDKATCQWMAGFYINNAVMRLHGLNTLPNLRTLLELEPLQEGISLIEMAQIEDWMNTPLAQAWDPAMTLFIHYVDRLQSVTRINIPLEDVFEMTSTP